MGAIWAYALNAELGFGYPVIDERISVRIVGFADHDHRISRAKAVGECPKRRYDGIVVDGWWWCSRLPPVT
jgi:hypothetical protein